MSVQVKPRSGYAFVESSFDLAERTSTGLCKIHDFCTTGPDEYYFVNRQEFKIDLLPDAFKTGLIWTAGGTEDS
jgi:hypothetical protein